MEFLNVEYSPLFKENVIQSDLLVKPGDVVRKFNGANDTIGHVILANADRRIIVELVKTVNQHVSLSLK